MNKILIKNAKIVNEDKIFHGDVYVEGKYIVEVAEQISAKSPDVQVCDAEDLHFRSSTSRPVYGSIHSAFHKF